MTSKKRQGPKLVCTGASIVKLRAVRPSAPALLSVLSLWTGSLKSKQSALKSHESSARHSRPCFKRSLRGRPKRKACTSTSRPSPSSQGPVSVCPGSRTLWLCLALSCLAEGNRACEICLFLHTGFYRHSEAHFFARQAQPDLLMLHTGTAHPAVISFHLH